MSFKNSVILEHVYLFYLSYDKIFILEIAFLAYKRLPNIRDVITSRSDVIMINYYILMYILIFKASEVVWSPPVSMGINKVS